MMQSFPTMMKIIILQSCVQGLYLQNIERSHVQVHFFTAHLVHFDNINGELTCREGKQLFLPDIPQAAQM